MSPRQRTTAGLICTLWPWLLSTALAQEAYPLKVVGEVPAPPPRDLTALGSRLFFAAAYEEHGWELWVSDLSPEGTVLFADLNPGPRSANPTNLLAAGDRFFFAAMDEAHGTELWVSDGSREGTRIVLDIQPGPRGANPSHLIAAGSRVYFTANPQGEDELELWVTDGSQMGTLRVVPQVRLPRYGDGCDSPFQPDLRAAVLGDRLVFAAIDPGSDASAVFITDGTGEGTQRLASGGTCMTPLRNGCLFFGYDDLHGVEPWFTDGTPEGTHLILDLLPGAGGSALYWVSCVSMGDRAVFQANDGPHGYELWGTDGTPEGTRLLVDATPGGDGVNINVLAPAGDWLFFSSHDWVHGVKQTWATDGTPAGTRPLVELYVQGSCSQWDRERDAVAIGSLVFFSSVAGELWSSNGTPQGTQRIAEIPSAGGSLHWLTLVGERLAFLTDSGELWMSDGTTEGTRLLGNPGLRSQLLDGQWNGYRPINATAAAFEERLFFAGDGGLWVTDGFPDGTQLVKSFDRLFPHPSPVDLTPLGSQLLFEAYDSEYGQELWVSDGTEGGTRLLADILPGPEGGLSGDGTGYTAELQATSDRLYFVADDGIHGRELWASDGSLEGTRLVRDISPGPGSSHPTGLIAAGRQLFFNNGGPVFPDLWVADITGARIVKKGIRLFDGVALGDSLAFSANPLNSGRYELWVSDGTDQGTRAVYEYDGPGGSDSLTSQGGRLYFVADDGVHGREPWTSDGSREGTRMLLDIAPGPVSSSPALFTALDTQIVFAADDGVHGREPWVSDGTPGGTKLLLDVQPGAAGSVRPADFGLPMTTAGSRLFASWDDGVHGLEPWVSDGTLGGTRLLEDLNPGPGGSSECVPFWCPIPSMQMALPNGAVVFSATDGLHAGLWALNLGMLPQQPRFLRADANADSLVDMSDAISTLGFLFLGDAVPDCLAAADANDSGAVDISDAVHTLTYLFLGGSPPPAPYPECGADGTPGELSCWIRPGLCP